ncbi:MAG TPA: IS1595 family transposase [Pyrinomonadaceae bacterium]|jgi:transposase-like protein
MSKVDLTAKQFHDEDFAREFLESKRWKDGVVCPHCNSCDKAYKLNPKADSRKAVRKGVWKCKECRKQFTVTVGTIFEKSRVPLHKWLLAMHLLCASKKGMSAHQLHRMLGVTYKSAWFMCHRIREAMKQEPIKAKLEAKAGNQDDAGKLQGTVEVDETYIGGKAKNMHARIRRERFQGRRGAVEKAPVVTIVERGGRVKSQYMEMVTGDNLKAALLECVSPLASICTDESPSYFGVENHFASREAVNHKKGEYVRGNAHVNTCESVHALMKRGVIGVYHHWSKKHLHRYLSEFDFRFNARKINDTERAIRALESVQVRLMYKDLING